MTLGTRIAALRRERGLSQEALGELVGVSRQAVSKWESDSALPDVNNCVALSRAFGITLAQLLELEEETAPSRELTQEQLEMAETIARSIWSPCPAPKVGSSRGSGPGFWQRRWCWLWLWGQPGGDISWTRPFLGWMGRWPTSKIPWATQ